MMQCRIKDNSQFNKEALSNIPELCSRIADKSLEQLEREGIFVFPDVIKNSDDLSREQMIFQSVNGKYRTGNVVGFLGHGDERLTITSRFGKGETDYLFQYLLERVLDIPNLLDLETDANENERLYDLLLFLFPRYLKEAVRKGIFKLYIRNYYNDSNVSGTIDVARHISKNTPFIGRIAYSKKEYSNDNYLMELIRHTIEYIKGRPFGHRLLSGIKDEVKLVVEATQNYAASSKRKIIEENKKNTVRHAYYHEYRKLQNLCLLILQHQKHQIGLGNSKVYGVLFDGAWLWEEYLYTIIDSYFYHPMNKVGSGTQWLFNNNRGKIYPDFIGKDKNYRIIADAKYKPFENIGNKDYLQILAYMYRFDAKTSFFLYPDIEEESKDAFYLNKGVSYERNVEAREEIKIQKIGLKIPVGVDNYSAFCLSMKNSENELIGALNDSIQM